MKHATPATLAQLEGLLDRLRGLPRVIERRPGVFYVKGKAFLHFHEDPAGIFADVKVGSDWKRLAVTGAPGRSDIVKLAARTLADMSA